MTSRHRIPLLWHGDIRWWFTMTAKISKSIVAFECIINAECDHDFRHCLIDGWHCAVGFPPNIKRDDAILGTVCIDVAFEGTYHAIKEARNRKFVFSIGTMAYSIALLEIRESKGSCYITVQQDHVRKSSKRYISKALWQDWYISVSGLPIGNRRCSASCPSCLE